MPIAIAAGRRSAGPWSEARTDTGKELSHLNITAREIELYQKLLSPLLYPSAAMRAAPGVLASNTLGQAGLWAFGVSGDYPVLLLKLKEEQGIALLQEVMQAYTYWRRRGLMIDVLILNRLESGYDQGLQGRIYRAIQRRVKTWAGWTSQEECASASPSLKT